VLIRCTLHCDNNGGGHFEELALWELGDIDRPVMNEQAVHDLTRELHAQATEAGWLLLPAEHDGWTRVLCPACCAGQGGG
jgi:hypothetical protein